MPLQRLLQLGACLIWSACLLAGAPAVRAAPQLETFRTAGDWQRGELDGLTVNNDGSLQLAADQAVGRFVGPALTLAPGTLLAVSRAALVPPGTLLATAWRSGRRTAADSVAWQDWQLLTEVSVDAVTTQSLAPLPLPDGAQLLQIAVLFGADGATSPRLNELNLRELPAVPPGLAPAGLPQRPLLNGDGPVDLRPLLVGRGTWDSVLPQQLPPARQPTRLLPVALPWPSDATALEFLRRLSRDQRALPAARDMALHFLIAPDGTLLEGVAGGAGRAAGPGDDGTVVIALAQRDDARVEQQAATLAALAAWLCTAYPTLTCALPVANDTAPAARFALQPPLQLPADMPARIAASRIGRPQLFAEGTTVDAGLRLSLANPSLQALTATLQLRDADGRPQQRSVALAARDRAELLLEAIAPAAADLPFSVSADGPLAAERTLLVAGELESSGGLLPARRWYFAEAGSQAGRRSFLVLSNPQRGASAVRLTVIGDDGVLLEQRLTVTGRARLVVPLHELRNPADQTTALQQPFSVIVSSARPIVAERTRRGDGNDAALAGGGGVSRPAVDWYFAEGTTENGWQQRLILLNPQAVAVTGTLIVRDQAGLVSRQPFSLAPLHRLTIDPAAVVGARGIAVQVRAERPIVAERLLWRDDRAAAALSPGLPDAGTAWLFAETRTRAAQVYLIAVNPQPGPAELQLTALGDSGLAALSFSVPAETRRVIALHELWPERSGLALLVSSDLPLAVEQTTLPGGIRGGMTVAQALRLR